MRNNPASAGIHPVVALPLPKRAINALSKAGIATLEETQDWSDLALLSLPQFGPAYLSAIRTLAQSQREH